MTDLKLTQEMIAEGMTRPEKVACAPGDSRCYVFPDPLDECPPDLHAKGRCCIGWIVATGGGTDGTWWLDVHTREGRLRRHTR